MFNFKKLKLKHALVFLLIFNAILLISIVFNILINLNIVKSNLLFIVAIGKYFSGNFFLGFSLLFVETFVLIYYWYTVKRKHKPTIQTNEDTSIGLIIDSDDSLEDFDEPLIEQNMDVSSLTVTDSPDEFDLSQDVVPIIPHSNNQILETVDDENDFSPSFLEGIAETQESPGYKLTTLKPIAQFNNNRHPILSERQFALYRNIVKIDWLYEKKADKQRIGFDNYSVDESNISYSDLSKLMKCGMVFKQKITHPKGSFLVYTANPEVEPVIIQQFIMDYLRKNRLKIFSRRITFQNWQEFGISKETWQFDFEVQSPPLIGCIWGDDAFQSSPNHSFQILSEKKEELKALIATATLKLNNGQAILILNNTPHLKTVQKFMKSVAWGDLVLLDFSNPTFYKSFNKLIQKSLGF